MRLEFITELTNLFNRTNFLSVNDVFGVNTPLLFGPFDVRGPRTFLRIRRSGITARCRPSRRSSA